MYIHTYIERERETERERDVWMYICVVYTHVYTKEVLQDGHREHGDDLGGGDDAEDLAFESV